MYTLYTAVATTCTLLEPAKMDVLLHGVLQQRVTIEALTLPCTRSVQHSVTTLV